jgi:hypothetical protein
MALAACAPDVMPVARASPMPVNETGDNQAPSAAPTTPVDASCGDSSVDDSANLLSPPDIWPQATQSGQGSATYVLDSDACRAQVDIGPAAKPDCTRAYPYYSDNDIYVELARAGVVLLITGDDMAMDSDGLVTGTVHEVVANLGPGGAAEMTALAINCDARPQGDDYKVVSHGHTVMLLHVGADQAVALTFDDPKLSESQRLALLATAVERATQ